MGNSVAFRDAPFFLYAGWCEVGDGLIESCFRLAIGKRCVSKKTKTLDAGFVIAFVLLV